jgi:hypothetical protein
MYFEGAVLHALNAMVMITERIRFNFIFFNFVVGEIKKNKEIEIVKMTFG